VNNVSTYRITFTNGSTFEYTVVNGTNGTNGVDGQTPYIGTNGNWWVGETDTGVAATGRDGENGVNGTDGNSIVSIELISTVNNVSTYRITFTNGSTFEYTVVNGTNGTNGVGIASVELYSTSGNVTTYRIYFTDGSIFDYQIVSGMSAYEIYLIYYPDYLGTEEDWINDLINGNLGNHTYYDVTFNSDGGTMVDAVQIRRGQKITKPNNPTKQGYIFDGWFVDDDKWIFSVYTVTENIELTAKWSVPQYDASDIYEQAAASVVEIFTFDDQNIPLNYGSGFFINHEGTLVTNYHVINRASKVVIEYDGDEYEVTSVKGYSLEKDIAYLDIDAAATPPLTLDSKTMKTGETIYTISNPVGMPQTLTQGIITFANRQINGVRYHQFSSELTSGSSGSPLLNKQGKVVGLVSKSISGLNNQFLALTYQEITSVSLNLNISVTDLFAANHIPTLSGLPNQNAIQEIESNDTILQAQPVQSEQSIASYMGLSDQDFFSIALEVNDEILVMLKPQYAIDLRYVELELVNAQGQVVAQSYLSRFQGEDVIIIRYIASISEEVYVKTQWSSQYPWPIGGGYTLYIETFN
jgi:uncharacterized repeat protein (TIGR02543 family)